MSLFAAMAAIGSLLLTSDRKSSHCIHPMDLKRHVMINTALSPKPLQYFADDIYSCTSILHAGVSPPGSGLGCEMHHILKKIRHT